MFNSAHIHVGTCRDEGRAILIENQMVRYAPAFAALAANSLASAGRRGDYKSYRVRHQAHGCTQPSAVRDPQMAQATWGSDAGPKMYGGPTLEVRIGDCASSRRFLAEFATFVASFVHHRGTQDGEPPLTPQDYRDSMINRWLAARHGLQATFLWKGTARPVADLLSEMLDECRDELAVLGAARSDLGLITAMLAKRTCQADFVAGLLDRYPDPYLFVSAYGKLMRHWTIFDEWLERAPVLDPMPAPAEETILTEHLAVIGEGTHFYATREAMNFPPPVADALLEQMIERGDIRREVHESRGTLLYRNR
jgi:hypothetical protein